MSIEVLDSPAAKVTVAPLPFESLFGVLPAALTGDAVIPAGKATDTVYDPTGSPVKEYSPFAPVTVVAETTPERVTVRPAMPGSPAS